MILIKMFIPMIVLVQLQTSSAIRFCENAWKENLGLSGSIKDFQNFLQIQRNFLSQNFTNKGIKEVDMERCSKSPECRIYTVIDKNKENSMILCIRVNETQRCYVLTCSCQKNRKKRAIKSHQVSTDPKEKPTIAEHIPAQCNISRDNGDYIPLKNKPTAATSYSGYSNASIGHFDDTTNIVLICNRNVKEKDRNIWLNILTFLFGGVVGAIVGIKRKSFKNIPGVNSLYIQGSNANENQIQAEYDDPEYSEIPVYLQVLETSSEESAQAVTIQKSPYRDQRSSSLDVETNINNINDQRNISVQKKNVLSSTEKLSDSICITMSRQQDDATGIRNKCVSEPFSDAYEIPINKTGFLTCNSDPATGCNVYHSLEDIPLVENEEDGDKTHVLSANDKPSLCTTNPRNTADRVCDRQETLRT
uniref:Uncharacterized protein LOC111106660 n=1 Tax=Crassostrea virginica TaxID=6565 RepID=A0A8B8B145_CRAVI|nr:uncharacterized protein LOC111106660 [Crassostrea virginica]